MAGLALGAGAFGGLNAGSGNHPCVWRPRLTPAPMPREKNGWPGWDSASHQACRELLHRQRISRQPLRPAPGPWRGRSSSPWAPYTPFKPTPHRADLPAPGSQAEGSRLQAGLTRSGQRWGEGGGLARKRCPARQPLVSTPWLPATGPGTPPREGCPRRLGHCWRAAPRGSGCSPPYTGSRAACPP